MTITRSVEIGTGEGLHARPAALLVEMMKSVSSDVTINKGEKSANARSIMSVLALGATLGDTVEVTVEGDDENDVADAVSHLLVTGEVK